MDDLISRQAAKLKVARVIWEDGDSCNDFHDKCVDCLDDVPSALHNITMNDVLKYIDGMPEDVWQEFTACLEYRGWELQRKTAKWCGSEFA